MFSLSAIELTQLENIRKGIFTLGKGSIIISNGLAILLRSIALITVFVVARLFSGPFYLLLLIFDQIFPRPGTNLNEQKLPYYSEFNKARKYQ